jgi:DNA polymerase III sliding clamp (beta) subunit (PCNA family)
MTMILDAGELAGALHAGARLDLVVERRPVRLVAEENAVRVGMADLTQGFSVLLTSPKADGEIVIDHRYLVAALKGMKAGAQVTIEPAKAQAKISVETAAGPKTSRVPMLDPSTVHTPPPADAAPIIIGMKELKRLLAAVRCAPPPSDTRYDMCGVHLVARQVDKGGPHRLVAEATDSQVGSITASEVIAPDDMQDAIVAHHTIAMVAALPIGDDESVGLAFTESHWILTTEKVRAQGQHIDGQFPDLRRVIPTEFEATALLDTDVLEDALAAAMPLTSDDKKNRGVFLGIRNGVLTVVGGAGGGGALNADAHARVDVDCATGGRDAWVWLNGENLGRVLSVHRAETVRLRKAPAGSIVLIDGVNALEDDPETPPPTQLGILVGLHANVWAAWAAEAPTEAAA